jgi:transposase
LGPVDEDELYTALDWLLERQPQVEAALARRHLKDGTLVLYDVSSSYLEGRCCPLAQFGFNRDGKRGKLQIVYGLLCAPDGCPVAIEVFEGSTGDPTTLAARHRHRCRHRPLFRGHRLTPMILDTNIAP